MATFQMSILAGMAPDESGGVFWQPYDLVDTGAVLKPLVLTYNDSTAVEGATGRFIVPQNFSTSGTTKVLVKWTANNATTNNARWELSYLTRTTGEDMGAAATSTSDNVNSAHDGTAFNLNSGEMTITSSDFAVGDVVTFELFRDSADANDTLAAAALVFDVIFEYQDS